MITVNQFIKNRDNLDNIVNKRQLELNAITKDQCCNSGLINEITRNSTEYKTAKNNFKIAFNNLRDYNKTIPNNIKREASKLKRRNK